MAKLSVDKFKKFFTKKRIIIGIILILIVGAIAFFGLSKSKKETAIAVSDYAEVTRRDITNTITGTAVVKPKDQYSVTSLVTGEVVSANFEEGDLVKEGDILYQIDTSDIENNISSANISLQKAQNNLDDVLKTQKDTNVTCDVSGTIKTLYVKEGDNVQNGAKIADVYDDSVMELTLPFNSSDISQIHVGDSATVTVVGSYGTLDGKVSAVKNASYSKAGNMLVQDVVINVTNPGVITNTDKGTASIGSVYCNDVGTFNYITEKTVTSKTSGEVAKINIKEGNKVKAGSVVVVLDSDSLESNIKSSKLSLEDAKLGRSKTLSQLEDYTIKAPISGTVITKNTKVGDKLDNTNKQEEMAIIYDMSSLEFELSVDELDINKIKVGQEVKITVDALSGKGYQGQVSKISIAGTESNGVTSYPVTVSITEFDDDLLPGMNINAEITISEVKDVLAVPKSAVARDNVVYVKGEKEDPSDKAPEGYKSVKVETGLNDDEYIEIISGLNEGDIVKAATVASSNGFNGMMGMGGMHGGEMPGGGGGMPSGGGGGMPGGGMPR